MRVLAIGAHYDDVELGCGGTLLTWQRLGYEITIFVATTSGYKNAQGDIIRSDEVARYEGEEAAKFIGARLIAGDISTFKLEFDEILNTKLLQVLDEVKPDIVLTHWRGDTHHDHRALALATIHTCRHIPRLLMYRSNWYESDEIFDPRFLVDISEQFDKKLELIQIFKSENQRTKGIWLTYITSQTRMVGIQCGVKYAEHFEVIKWLN